MARWCIKPDNLFSLNLRIQQTNEQTDTNMSKTFQNHMRNNHTSAFTLPTPRKERQRNSSSKGVPATATATTLHSPATDPCDEFSTSCSHQSPYLPWLVEYWSSSFFRGPELFFDHLCSRSPAAEIDWLNECVKTSAYMEVQNQPTTEWLQANGMDATPEHSYCYREAKFARRSVSSSSFVENWKTPMKVQQQSNGLDRVVENRDRSGRAVHEWWSGEGWILQEKNPIM